MLTFSCRAFINSTSRGRRLTGEEHKHVCVCVCEHKHIERLHRECCTSLSSCAVFCMLSVVPVAKRRDEVEAAVDSVVLDVPPVQPALISEVLLKLLVDVVFYFLPAIANM